MLRAKCAALGRATGGNFYAEGTAAAAVARAEKSPAVAATITAGSAAVTTLSCFTVVCFANSNLIAEEAS
jgi:hypothetical protein